MGTRWEVSVVSPGLTPERRVELAGVIESALDRVDSLMSHYREDSELSRFNRSTGLAPFPVSGDTLEVLRVALEVGTLSGGALDVTVAPLVDAWGFGPGPPPEHPPSEARIAELLEVVGLDRIRLDPAAATVARTRPGVALDVSAVAKGHAVDLIALALAREGHENALVDVGGEVRAAGRNAKGEPWRIGIELPQSGLPALHSVVPLSGAALATSGEYRNFRIVDGVRASHTIDPRSGRPIRHRLASVSVVSATCARADALATALNVLGPEAGWELAVAEDLAALFLVARPEGGFEERRTPAFERLAATTPLLE
jgi:thiamine biosynthesis lipoprotein